MGLLLFFHNNTNLCRFITCVWVSCGAFTYFCCNFDVACGLACAGGTVQGPNSLGLGLTSCLIAKGVLIIV